MIKLGGFDQMPTSRGVATTAVVSQTAFVKISVTIETAAVVDRTILDVGGDDIGCIINRSRMALVTGHIDVAPGQGETGRTVLKFLGRTPARKTVTFGTLGVQLPPMPVGMTREAVTFQPQESLIQRHGLLRE